LGSSHLLRVVEVFGFFVLVIVRPFQRADTNVLEIFLSVVRIVSVDSLITFSGSLGLNRYVVTGFGIGLLAI